MVLISNERDRERCRRLKPHSTLFRPRGKQSGALLISSIPSFTAARANQSSNRCSVRHSFPLSPVGLPLCQSISICFSPPVGLSLRQSIRICFSPPVRLVCFRSPPPVRLVRFRSPPPVRLVCFRFPPPVRLVCFRFSPPVRLIPAGTLGYTNHHQLGGR